jgi:flagellar basal body-associated protein FliL
MVMKNLAVPLAVLVVLVILVILVVLVVLVVLVILVILIVLVGKGSEVQFEPADPPDMYVDDGLRGAAVEDLSSGRKLLETHRTGWLF